jgi:hypothetical protein
LCRSDAHRCGSGSPRSRTSCRGPVLPDMSARPSCASRVGAGPAPARRNASPTRACPPRHVRAPILRIEGRCGSGSPRSGTINASVTAWKPGSRRGSRPSQAREAMVSKHPGKTASSALFERVFANVMLTHRGADQHRAQRAVARSVCRARARSTLLRHRSADRNLWPSGGGDRSRRGHARRPSAWGGA